MKTNQDPTLNRYLTSDYLQKNPEWDFADTGWKAEISFEKTMQDLLDYWRQKVNSSGDFFTR